MKERVRALALRTPLAPKPPEEQGMQAGKEATSKGTALPALSLIPIPIAH